MSQNEPQWFVEFTGQGLEVKSYLIGEHSRLKEAIEIIQRDLPAGYEAHLRSFNPLPRRKAQNVREVVRAAKSKKNKGA